MTEETFSMFTARRDLQATLGLSDPPPPPVQLTEKYRPGRLEDLVGQFVPVCVARAFLEAPYSTAFLFSGPTGTGKTSLARIMAAELGAVEFGGLDIIKSGTHDAEAVTSALRSLRYTPMLGSGWKVVIVDEADCLSPKAAQLWLSALEDLPPRSVVIFTTNHAGKFPDRFLDRCQWLEFEADAALHRQDAEALIAAIWARETGHTHAPSLAEVGGGAVDATGLLSYRRVVRAIEAALVHFRRTGLFRPVPTRPVTADVPPDLAARRKEAARKAVATRRARQLRAQESIDG